MKIIITEAQEKMLHNKLVNEAMMDSFSYDELSSLRSFAKRLDYCKRHLGMPIGQGSSRIIFQIDDEKVLKLARNKKGLAQNEYEYDHYYPCDEDILPRCYECADDYTWIVSEYVLPAEKEDFEEVFGLWWDEFASWINSTYKQYVHSSKCRFLDMMNHDEWLDTLENNDGLQPLYNWMTNNQYESIGDLKRIANWGLTVRDGEPCLVILDNGLSEDIYNQYYKKW